jgi:hypothetical protein
MTVLKVLVKVMKAQKTEVIRTIPHYCQRKTTRKETGKLEQMDGDKDCN